MGWEKLLGRAKCQSFPAHKIPVSPFLFLYNKSMKNNDEVIDMKINKFGISVVAVDYDGTLTTENAYPAVGTPNIRAVEIMKRFRALGGRVILWTLRTNKYLDDAVASMKSLGLEFDAVNDDDEICKKEWLEAHPDCGISRKTFADLYIDDRTPHAMIHGIDWDEIEEMLLVPVQF